jgi:hypothetical protein
MKKKKEEENTNISRGGNDAVREEEEVEANVFEDALEELDCLKGQHILTDIVSDLEDTSLPVGRQLLIAGASLDLGHSNSLTC